MKIYDPTATAQQQSLTQAPRLSSLQNAHIALLSNGKANADRLLLATAQRFAEQHNCTFTEVAFKPHAGAPAAPDLLQGLAHEAAFLLTAAGD